MPTRHYMLIIMSFCALLQGCDVQQNKQQSLSSPIEVTQDNLAEYWLSKNTSDVFNMQGQKMPKVAGTVKLKYLINDLGQVSNVSVVESMPAGAWDKFAVQAIEQRSYKATAKNSNNNAVYTVVELSFEPN